MILTDTIGNYLIYAGIALFIVGFIKENTGLYFFYVG
jgi:hypothetical protein